MGDDEFALNQPVESQIILESLPGNFPSCRCSNLHIFWSPSHFSRAFAGQTMAKSEFFEDFLQLCQFLGCRALGERARAGTLGTCRGCGPVVKV